MGNIQASYLGSSSKIVVISSHWNKMIILIINKLLKIFKSIKVNVMNNKTFVDCAWLRYLLIILEVHNTLIVHKLSGNFPLICSKFPTKAPQFSSN